MKFGSHEISFHFISSDTINNIDGFIERCDDSNIKECLTMSRNCNTYIATNEHDMVCAVASVTELKVSSCNFWVLDNVISKGCSDRSYKGVMLHILQEIKKSAVKAKVQFLWIHTSTIQGLKFYIKFGFLVISRTKMLVMPLLSTPSCTTVRSIEVMEHEKWTLILGRPETLHIKARSDTSNYRKRRYGLIDVALFSALGKSKRYAKTHTIIYSTMFTVKFPMWMYRLY